MVEFTTHRYPCIDKYPPHSEFITDAQILDVAQAQLKEQGLQGKLSTSNLYTKLSAAFKVAAIWKQPQLRIAFLDGTPHQQAWVHQTVRANIEPLTSRLAFKWNVPVEESDIRISFAIPEVAWSFVGTDALKIPKTDPTMNLGWLDDDVSYDSEAYRNTGHVVLHEFGHLLGMIHEHQNPKANPIVWNKDIVSRELAISNGWDEAQIQHNMFEKYGDYALCQQAKQEREGPRQQANIDNFCKGELVNGSEYDKTSIMHYFYPARWIQEGPVEIPVNTALSEMDKTWIRKYYGDTTEGFSLRGVLDLDDAWILVAGCTVLALIVYEHVKII